ncbi:CoA-binding protein [Pseudooceanicola aestuarii]|uniref:CoA-binding protein n=1 Tax=Pseudooceanicola aestuarii TaxID=2697319 RepID=UPI0013D0ACF6|nr:CoA-binding protein [Pseudooceanicola aestuarii]
MTMTDPDIHRILTRTRVIAVVGVSANPVRPSNYVARYLSLKGYRVVPVNPALAGEELFGETVHPSLTEAARHVPDIDMVDLFRRSEHVPPLVDEALEVFPELATIWMQIGIIHDGAAETARARGVEVVMDRCPKIEYQRLFGELRMGGFATGVISSKL